MSFLLGVVLTTLAFALMPPAWASALSWRVRDALVEVRAWWRAVKRRGGD